MSIHFPFKKSRNIRNIRGIYRNKILEYGFSKTGISPQARVTTKQLHFNKQIWVRAIGREFPSGATNA